MDGAARSRTRRRGRWGGVAALTATITALGAPAAFAAPAATVSPTVGLWSGQALTATGTGFEPATYPQGVYAAQTAIVDGVVRFSQSSAKLIRTNPTSGSASQAQLESDGSFATTVTVTRSFTSGGVAVDCAQVQCAVSTWQAQRTPAVTPSTPSEVPLLTTAALSFTAATVTPTVDVADGQALAISGTGFDTTTFPQGVYAAQTAIVDGVVRFSQASSKLIRTNPTSGSASQAQLQPDGSFATTVTVARTFTSGGVTVDCALVVCAISTWRAQRTPAVTPTQPSEAPLLTTAAVALAAAPAPPPPPPPPGASGTPALAVSPSTGLTGPTTVAISGTGFDPAANGGIGVYVVYGPRGADFATNAGSYGAAAWIPGSAMTSEGAFAANLPLTPTYTDGGGATVDCRQTQCYVLTMAAHGSADRSQDTAVPISFASAVAADVAAGQASGAPGQAGGAASGPGGATPAPTPAPSVRNARVSSTGAVSLRLTGAARVTIEVRRAKTTRRNGKTVTRWVLVKRLRVAASKAGLVERDLGLHWAGAYRITLKVTGANGATRTVKLPQRRIKARPKA